MAVPGQNATFRCYCVVHVDRTLLSSMQSLEHVKVGVALCKLHGVGALHEQVSCVNGHGLIYIGIFGSTDNKVP